MRRIRRKPTIKQARVSRAQRAIILRHLATGISDYGASKEWIALMEAEGVDLEQAKRIVATVSLSLIHRADRHDKRQFKHPTEWRQSGHRTTMYYVGLSCGHHPRPDGSYPGSTPLLA